MGELKLRSKHRLLCGDSTSADDVARLINGEFASFCFTDPPYGIGYKYNSHDDIGGDRYLAWCDEWWSVLAKHCHRIVISTGWANSAFWWNKGPTDCLHWLCKNKTSGGVSSYLRKVEPLMVFGKLLNKYSVDYFDVLNNYNNEVKGLHTCPKPVDLLAKIIEPQTSAGDIVVDIFLGSGTALAVCEQLNRRCYGMEIDPVYCDVIVQRWENLTGGKAVCSG